MSFEIMEVDVGIPVVCAVKNQVIIPISKLVPMQA